MYDNTYILEFQERLYHSQTYDSTIENECLTKKKKKNNRLTRPLCQLTIDEHTDSNFASDYYNYI